jgi:hypothetical protein
MEATASDGEQVSLTVHALKGYLISLAQPMLQLSPSVAENAFTAFVNSEDPTETLTRFVTVSEVSIVFVAYDASTECKIACRFSFYDAAINSCLCSILCQ